MINLRHSHNTKKEITTDEFSYIDIISIYGDEQVRLLNKAYELKKKGRADIGNKYLKAANLHTYLFYYAKFISNFLDRRPLSDNRDPLVAVKCKYDFDCVEKAIPCLSSEFNTDLTKTWSELKDYFGISSQVITDECCLGVGGMIIDDPDDCISLIVGPCDENELVPPYGEFNQCEFVIEEFSEPEGENLYENCD